MKASPLLSASLVLLAAAFACQAEELSFGPQLYIDRFNRLAAGDYAIVKEGFAGGAGGPEFKLSKGTRTLEILGREKGSLLESVFIGKAGVKPSSGKGVILKAGQAVLSPPMALRDGVLASPADSGSAKFKFELEEDGVYELWGKVCGPNSAANSFRFALDGASPSIWDIPVGTSPEWTRLEGRGVDYFSNKSFILTWAATSPHSKLRDDPELRRIALRLTKVQFEALRKRRVFPASLWYQQEIESLRLWQEDPRTPREELPFLMESLRPCVESCYAMVSKGKGWNHWVENAPNIQLQSAAILRLASEIWKEADPAASKLWASTSSACIERAWLHKLPKGGFRYSHNTGMDVGYFAEDAQHLALYYLLTKDPKVAGGLRDMAEVAKNSSSYGQAILIGSPWWKHTFDTYNRNQRVSELILSLSKDPLYASFMELNRKRLAGDGKDRYSAWLMCHLNIFAPELRVKAEPIVDACFMSVIENGPALRAGPLNVAMPWQFWTETTCGACFSSPEAVESEVCSSILTATTPGIDGRTVDTGFSKYRESYSGAYSIIYDPAFERRAVVCGPDFIASATSFRPAGLPIYSFTENKSPWLRTDIHFADRTGFASALELKALEDNNCDKVVIWTRVSDDQKTSGSKIKVKGMTVSLDDAFSGKIRNLGKVWGYPGSAYPLDLLETVLKKSGPDGFKKGERFSTKLALEVDGKSRLAVGEVSKKGDLKSVEIVRDGKPFALLLFNEGSETKWPAAGFVSAWRSGNLGESGAQVELKDVIDLPKDSLTALFKK